MRAWPEERRWWTMGAFMHTALVVATAAGLQTFITPALVSCQLIAEH